MGIKFSRSAGIIGGQSELDEYVNRSVVLRINKSEGVRVLQSTCWNGFSITTNRDIIINIYRCPTPVHR